MCWTGVCPMCVWYEAGCGNFPRSNVAAQTGRVSPAFPSIYLYLCCHTIAPSSSPLPPCLRPTAAGVTPDQFRASGAAEVARQVVSAVTGVPVADINVTYTPAVSASSPASSLLQGTIPRGVSSRRRLLQDAQVSEGGCALLSVGWFPNLKQSLCISHSSNGGGGVRDTTCCHG